MKIHKLNTYIFTFFVSILFSLKHYSQSVQVPKAPEKLRKLPTDYQEKYQTNEFDYTEHISFLDRFKAKLFDLLSRWFSVGNKDVAQSFENLKLIFYFVVIIGAIYLIVKLLINKEGRWLFSRNPEKEPTVDFDEIKNIKEEDLKKLIFESENELNYRLAIKYYYLYLLKKMDEAVIISYDPQKTSHDYSLHLEGTTYYHNFSKCAYYYTYIWYGEFAINEVDYKKASSSFVKLLNQFNDE